MEKPDPEPFRIRLFPLAYSFITESSLGQTCRPLMKVAFTSALISSGYPSQMTIHRLKPPGARLRTCFRPLTEQKPEPRLSPCVLRKSLTDEHISSSFVTKHKYFHFIVPTKKQAPSKSEPAAEQYLSLTGLMRASASVSYCSASAICLSHRICLPFCRVTDLTVAKGTD